MYTQHNTCLPTVCVWCVLIKDMNCFNSTMKLENIIFIMQQDTKFVRLHVFISFLPLPPSNEKTFFSFFSLLLSHLFHHRYMYIHDHKHCVRLQVHIVLVHVFSLRGYSAIYQRCNFCSNIFTDNSYSQWQLVQCQLVAVSASLIVFTDLATFQRKGWWLDRKVLLMRS